MLSNKQSEDRLTPATFMNVTQIRECVPSWLAPRSDDESGRTETVGATSSGLARSGPAPSPVAGGVLGLGRSAHGSVPAGQQPIRVLAVDGTDGAALGSELDALQEERRALDEAKAQTVRLNAELTTAIARLQCSRDEMLDAATRQVVELALLATRRIITREATLEPGVLAGIVREALRALAEREPIRVRVGSGFEPALRAASSSLAQSGTLVEFGVDIELEEFGCVVQTDIASVDEGLGQRFDALLDALRIGMAE